MEGGVYDQEENKVCSKCKQAYPRIYKYFSTRSVSGVTFIRSWCRVCDSADVRKRKTIYRSEHREEYNAYMRIYHRKRALRAINKGV
jgi:hypothetical protein